MNLRKIILVRTVVLLAALIFLCNIAMVIFLIRQNRAAWKRLGGDEAVFIASQSERLLLWDDQVAVHDLIMNRKRLNGHIDNMFIEMGGAPYAHTFPTGVPTGLIGFHGPLPDGYAVREVRDGQGRVFYDISSQVRGMDAVVHLLLSRNTVDNKALGLVVSISVICLTGWLLSILPAMHSAGAITQEADKATRDLQNLNEQLETRILERTAELSTTNEKLKTEIAEKKRLEKEKDDFYAMVTHDLKSPIAVIAGYADLIREMNAGLNSEALEMLGHIRQSSKKLSNIVDEFLTISRLERGTMTLNISINDINGLVREVLEDCTPMCKEKDIVVTAELEDDLPKALMDKFYVQRAVANLVQNAIKFTPEGGRVSVCVRRAGENDNYVTVSVSDTGIGIPADEQDKVFDKYYRSPSAAGTKGSGLGLAIVKAVATAHSGSVELQSEVGKGSTFSLKLPLTPDAILAT